MNIDLNLILPEIFLSLSIMSLLMIGVFKKNSSNLIFNLSILTLFILAALILNLSSVNKILIFNNSYVIDDVANFMKILTAYICNFCFIYFDRFFEEFKNLPN